jgi:hypothetical protein
MADQFSICPAKWKIIYQFQKILVKIFVARYTFFVQNKNDCHEVAEILPVLKV